MNSKKINYRILKFYNLDLISNLIQNKIEENIECNFIYDDKCNIYNILNNILGDFLIKFNRVLLISNSIDELYKHNKIISSLKENIYDVSKEYNIEMKLKNQFSSLPDNTGKTLLSKIDVLNRRIDKNTEMLNKIINFFYNKDSEGLNLVDKYYITEQDIRNNEKIYYYYKIFRIKKPFENLSYYEIKNIKEEIEKRNLIPIYIKYRRYLDNSRFMILKNNINNVLLEESIKKLLQINKTNTLNFNCSNLKYKKDFIENFIINQNMTQFEVNELVEIINIKHNGHLLDKKVKKTIFSFFRKNKMEYKKDDIEKYNYLKKDISRDFNIIYNNLNLELNKWSFLSEILVEEEYLRFKLMIIKGKDIKEKIMFYYKLLQISKDIEAIKIHIESLDLNIKEVLDYCYDNIEYKNDLDNIIKSIDRIKLYYDIENIEISNDNIVDEYKKFDIIKESIYKDVKNRNLLIEEGLKLLWDNLIRETYKISNLNIDKVDYTNKELFKGITPIVFSNSNKIFEDEIFSNIDFFDKIILLDPNKNIDIERIRKNVKENKLIVFNNPNKDIIETRYEINRVYLNKINEMSIKENYINYNILDDIVDYISNNGYIINKDITYQDYTYRLVINKINSNKKIGIIIDIEFFNYKGKYYIKELYSNKIEEDFFIYRIWSRDIWFNRKTIFKELLEYAREVL